MHHGRSSYRPRSRRLGLVAVFAVLASAPALPCTVVQPWAPVLTLTKSDKVHDLLDWNGKLWIAQGSGLSGTGKAVISSYDIATGVLKTEFEVPPGHTGAPYWRSLAVFNNVLYAGLGNNQQKAGTGDVYRFDGTSWTVVLDTDDSDVYALGVYNGSLYAGVGIEHGKAGTLYVSSDGLSWKALQTFSADYVRSLVVWNGSLYIGLKNPARLWSYDGRTFTDHGTPPGVNAQIKSLVPYGSLLYLGTVGKAQIWSWNGTSFHLSLDASSTDEEIYKGAVYTGCLFFPTNAKVGGRVWKFNGATWIADYVDATTSNQFQVVAPYAGYLYLGGGQLKGFPLTLRRTLQR
jgi:hypothetical protein